MRCLLTISVLGYDPNICFKDTLNQAVVHQCDGKIIRETYDKGSYLTMIDCKLEAAKEMFRSLIDKENVVGVSIDKY